MRAETAIFCTTVNIGSLDKERPWNEKKAIIDKVHRHICGHSNYTDMKIFLERNGFWDESVPQYVAELRTL